MTSKSKTKLPPNPEIEGLRIVDLIITEIEEAHMNKTCGKGEYYCYESKKCKKIPKGSHMNSKGRLVPDNDDGDDQEDGGDQAIDPGGMSTENVVLHTADGKKFAEIIDLIRPEDVMPKMNAADQWIGEEDSYAQAKKELKATKSARDHRHNTIHKSTNTKGNVDVNENLDDKRRANVQKQKQQSSQTVASAQKSQDSTRQVFAKRAQAVAKAKQKAKERANLSKEIDRKVAAATQSEEAVSKKQQRFMGAVLHAKRTGESSTPEVAKAAGNMKTKDVKDFASTKHKGLPEKKKQSEELQMTVDEAVRLPSEFGNLMMVGVSWRGKMYNIKMFFPQATKPTRKDVQDEVVKVYPGCKVQYFDQYDLASQEAQWDNDSNPIIKVTKEELEIEESKCKCDCGKVPCITCGGDHHKKEVKEAKAKYDNTKSPDYEKKRKALAKKHGGEENIKGHPQYENRFASHTAGMSDAQKDAASTKVSKGFAYKMGRRADKDAFSRRKKEGKRGQPQQYRKSADNPEWEGRFPYGKSNIRQGKGSFKGLKKEELLKSLKGFMGEGRIADAMRANLEKLKASEAKSSKNLDNFLKKSKKVRDDEKKAQDNS